MKYFKYLIGSVFLGTSLLGSQTVLADYVSGSYYCYESPYTYCVYDPQVTYVPQTYYYTYPTAVIGGYNQWRGHGSYNYYGPDHGSYNFQGGGGWHHGGHQR